jgi:uncharacterized protein involved in exopolysaccharide biosynthesis
MKDAMNGDEIRLDQYVRAVWRAKWLILLGTLLAALATAYLANRQPTLHKATAMIKVGRVWKEPLEDIYITERIINSPSFLRSLAQKIGVKGGQLKQSIRAETVIAGPRKSRYPILVSVTATTDNAEDAARYARAVADEISARHEALFNEALKPHLEQQARLEARYKELAAQGATSRDLLFKVENELNEVKANNTVPSANITEKTHLIEEVEADGTIKPEIWRRTAAAGLIAAVACIAVAALIGHFKSDDQRDAKS